MAQLQSERTTHLVDSKPEELTVGSLRDLSLPPDRTKKDLPSSISAQTLKEDVRAMRVWATIQSMLDNTEFGEKQNSLPRGDKTADTAQPGEFDTAVKHALEMAIKPKDQPFEARDIPALLSISTRADLEGTIARNAVRTFFRESSAETRAAVLVESVDEPKRLTLELVEREKRQLASPADTPAKTRSQIEQLEKSYNQRIDDAFQRLFTLDDILSHPAEREK